MDAQENAGDKDIPQRQTGLGISVIVPTLNEAGNINPLLEAILAQSGKELDLEVLIADGGSTDGTIERVRLWESRAPVRLVASIGAGGLAGDVLAAARAAVHEIVVVMDADFSHPPACIPELVRPIASGSADMVIGSRYVPGGSTPDWPWSRKLLSRGGGALAWPLADVKDPMSGFFAVRRKDLLAVDPSTCGFKIGLEVLAAGGDALRVAEAPITFRDRVRGESKIGLPQMADYCRRLMVLAGGSVSMGNATRFALVGLLGIGIDLLAFHALFTAGLGLVTAHVSSFALATVSNYALNSRWAFADSADTASESEWRRYMRFLAVCLMALFLRGGVLALAVNLWGWPPQAAIFLGVASAAIVNYLGNAFFVFASKDACITDGRRWRAAALGIFAYVVVLRLIFIGSADLLPEEAYYWNYAQHLDIGYLDHPPMVAWLIWAGTHLFANTEFGVRLSASVMWLIAAFFCYRLACNLYGKTTAFVAVLLFATFPFFFVMGLLMFPDAPLTAAWAGALYFLERALRGERSSAWWGVGTCVGLGLLSKYTMALLGPATLLFLILNPPSRWWLRRPGPYIAILVSALLFFPTLIWNAQHDWASFAFQGARRMHRSLHFSLPKLIGSMIILLTPIGFGAAIAAFMPRRRSGEPSAGHIDPRTLFVTVYTLAPLSVFVAFSLFHQTSLNWTGPLWLAALPIIARNIVAGGSALGTVHRKLQHSWTAAFTVMLLLYGATLHYVALGFPGVGHRNSLHSFAAAWSEFGDQAEQIERDVERQTGKEPILVGLDNYRLSSELAFYDGGDNDGARDTAGRNLFGQSSLMYQYWFSPKLQNGRTVILFSLNSKRLSSDSITARFRDMGPVQRRDVYKDSKPAGHFYYRVGYNFQAG